MTVKNRFIGVIASILVAMIIAVILILFWMPLTIMIEGISVGIFMLIETQFWLFVAFVGGLILVITLITRFTLLAKWGSKNQ